MTAAAPSSSTPVGAPAVVIVRATHDEAAGASLKVAGLSVFERAIRQLRRHAGLRVIIVTDGAAPLPAALPDGVEVRTATSPADAASLVATLTATMPATVVVGADVVRRSGEPLGDGLRVVDEATRGAAEDAIFRDLLRGDLGFVARHLNKKISFRITRHLLCKLPITPNQVTLGAAAIGLLGCVWISSGTYAATVAGFLLNQLQSILDGCDGELARVRFQQSAIGEWLDTLVDDFLNLALVASMGIGLWRAGAGWPAAVAATAACVMLLFYNAVSYRELVKQGVGGELIKIRWKLVRGRDMKSMVGGGGRVAGRAARGLLALGRRDLFIFSWLLLAVVKLLPVALLWAFLVALVWFVTAVGQFVVRERPAQTRPSL